MAAAGTTARAHVNVALVKYWGKRDPDLNLPSTGSISLTLDRLADGSDMPEDRDRLVALVEKYN